MTETDDQGDTEELCQIPLIKLNVKSIVQSSLESRIKVELN